MKIERHHPHPLIPKLVGAAREKVDKLREHSDKVFANVEAAMQMVEKTFAKLFESDYTATDMAHAASALLHLFDETEGFFKVPCQFRYSCLDTRLSNGRECIEVLKDKTFELFNTYRGLGIWLPNPPMELTDPKSYVRSLVIYWDHAVAEGC